MYKGSQQLNFTNFIYLHETKMIYLYLKGKDIHFCVSSLYFMISDYYVIIYILCKFQKVSFPF